MLRSHRVVAIATLVAASLEAGCAAPLNYVDPSGPRYVGDVPPAILPRDTLKVVTFNVEFGLRVDSAIRVLREDPVLGNADIIALQEMDEPGTRAIADSLGLTFVYYPSTLHPSSGRDFGNAVLSRYPIEDDGKIVLPHRQRLRRTIRTAAAATIRVGDRHLRVYSIHAPTLMANGPRQRRQQLAAVLADADRYSLVVLAGDFNSGSLAKAALSRGFTWPTRRLGRTTWLLDADHVLLKGMALAGDSARGIVRNVRGASDHRPVWARIVVPRAESSAAERNPDYWVRDQGRIMLEQTRTLHSAGIPLGLGTDAPELPWGVHLELERLVAAGLTPLEAIRAGTLNAARILGHDAESGTVEEGKLADLLVLEPTADPTRDIRDSRRIRYVILGGRLVDRKALRDPGAAAAWSRATNAPRVGGAGTSPDIRPISSRSVPAVGALLAR